MRKILLLWAIVGLSFTACKKDGPIGADALEYVPATASAVSLVDIKALMADMDFEAVQGMSFYKNAIEENAQNNPALAEVLRDPKQSGIDLEGQAVMLWDNPGGTPDGIVAGILLPLGDAGAFEKLLRSAEGMAFSKGEGFQLATQGEGFAAWNDELAFVGAGGDAVDAAMLAAYFKKDPENSLAKNTSFQAAFAKGQDAPIRFWTGSDALAQYLPNETRQSLIMAGIDPEWLKGNHVHGHTRFEAGRAVTEAHIDVRKELARELDMFFREKPTTDFQAFVPAEGLSSLMGGALDLRGAYQFMQEKNFGGMVDFMLKENGALFTLDDVATALQGDFVWAMYEADGPAPYGLFATKVEEKSLQKLLDMGLKTNMLEDKGQGRYAVRNAGMASAMAPLGGKRIELLVRDGLLFISDRSAMLDQAAKGGYAASARVGKDEYAMATGGVFGLYSNGRLGQQATGGVDLDGAEVLLSVGKKDSRLEVRHPDQSANILKSLMEALNANYEAKQPVF